MTLQELIEDLGYDTRSYSGRGMYGTTCLGVSLDKNDLQFMLELGHAMAEHNNEIDTDTPEGADEDELIRLPKRVSSDSMGLGSIVYFPNVEYKDEDEN